MESGSQGVFYIMLCGFTVCGAVQSLSHICVSSTTTVCGCHLESTFVGIACTHFIKSIMQLPFCPVVTILRLCLIVGTVPGRNWV